MKVILRLIIPIIMLTLIACSGGGGGTNGNAYADEWDSVEVLGIERINLPSTTYVYSVCVEGWLWVLTIKGDAFSMQQAFDDGVYSGQAAIPCVP